MSAFLMKCKMEQNDLYYEKYETTHWGDWKSANTKYFGNEVCKHKAKETIQVLYAIWLSFVEGYKLMNLILQYIYNGIEQLHKWVVDDVNQVFHHWCENLQMRRGEWTHSCNQLELETSVWT